MRSPAFLLVAVDEPLRLSGWPVALIEIELLENTPYQAQLIVAVEYLERFAEPRLSPVGAQQPVRKTVECAHPHATNRKPEQLLDATAHLQARLVGESHRQDGQRRYTERLHQPRHAVGENPGLAAACSGEHEYRSRRGTDRFALRVVQIVEDVRDVHDPFTLLPLVMPPLGLRATRIVGSGGASGAAGAEDALPTCGSTHYKSFAYPAAGRESLPSSDSGGRMRPQRTVPRRAMQPKPGSPRRYRSSQSAGAATIVS